MSRTDFLKKIIRTGLLLILALISMALGGKIISGNPCTGCRSKALCKGDSYCELFSRK